MVGASEGNGEGAIVLTRLQAPEHGCVADAPSQAAYQTAFTESKERHDVAT
jgi:hypothetical protein